MGGDTAMASTAPTRPSLDNNEAPVSTSPDIVKSRKQSSTETIHSNESSPSPEPNDSETRPSLPIQKRRRVTRACDECRRKKIKCDGKQPCTHCTVYSYECTYDQPSNRRRNPAPQYIEALEQRLQKTEAVIRAILPGVEIDDPKFDVHGVEQIIEASKAGRPVGDVSSSQKSDDDTQMQSMVEQTGSLDLDDSGNWDFHGHSSGYMFVRRFRTKFGTQLLPATKSQENRNLSLAMDSPRSMRSLSFDVHGTLISDLPPKEVALECCRAAIDNGCALTRPLHRPSFFQRVNTIYETDPEQWNTEQYRFIPLLYSVMALGCLFTQDDGELLDKKGYSKAIEQGYQWFNISKSSIDITDCRDIMAIQTVIFMIFFLQGSAKLATCYSYVGIALRACCRLGMHRKVQAKFNVIEQEERKRAFWLVRKLDTYVGTMLGLPQMLSDDDIDQEPPLEVHDDYITESGIVQMPARVFPLIKATNAHTRLMYILKKVLHFVYPLKPTGSKDGQAFTITIGHSRIRELEKDLQMWMDELPVQLRPSGDADTELSRVQQLLRMSYAYVQITMYRPFLHYVSPSCQPGRVDKRSFACAAACVSVARNIVHITSEMRRRGLLGGAYWFVMYITYFAILSLVYFVLENPDSTACKDILSDAREGHETLASLARRSFAADRCTISLNQLFDDLPEKLKERRTSLHSAPNVSKKRSQPTESIQSANVAVAAVPRSVPVSGNFGPPGRARTIPHDFLNRANKRSSLPNSPSTISTPFSVASDNKLSQGLGSSFTNTPQGTPPVSMSQMDINVPPVLQGNFLDLQNVMFPSDNPFAYGNQPISTLENGTFGALQDVPYPTDQFAATGETNFSSPQSMHSQSQARGDFDISGFSNYGEQLPRLGGSQHRGSFVSSTDPGSNRHSMFGIPGGIADDISPATSHQQQPAPTSGGDDFWTHQQQAQQSKQHFRPGFGQNAHGVNLDELFGGGNGWGPMNMSMDVGGSMEPDLVGQRAGPTMHQQTAQPQQGGFWGQSGAGGWV